MTPAERLAEFERLACEELDLFLEQRVLYRQLVAEGGHWGVRAPVRPKYLSRRALQNLEPRHSPKAASRAAPLLVRAFEVQLESDKGRTVEARIVPYGRPARVADPPDYAPYDEVWVRGAFEEQLCVPGRPKVWLNFEHEQGLRGIVGHALALRDEDDGLHGSFRVHDNSDGPCAKSSAYRHAAVAGLLAFLIGTVGGVSALIAATVTPQFRAWNRISIFIAFFALLAVALALTSLGRRWRHGRRR